MRKSKNDAFCFFTQFAFTKAYGKGEIAARSLRCALKKRGDEGKTVRDSLPSENFAGSSTARDLRATT